MCRSRSRRPEYTANADALGHIAVAGGDPHPRHAKSDVRFYQASTSELYGKVQEMPQTRDDAVLSALALRGGQALCLLDHRQLPRGLWHACVQRHLFNHEGPTRGETFVTRKITRAVAAIGLG